MDDDMEPTLGTLARFGVSLAVIAGSSLLFSRFGKASRHEQHLDASLLAEPDTVATPASATAVVA